MTLKDLGLTEEEAVMELLILRSFDVYIKKTMGEAKWHELYEGLAKDVAAQADSKEFAERTIKNLYKLKGKVKGDCQWK